MITIKFTKKEIEEITFALVIDKTTRGKSAQKSFQTGRKKFLLELKKIE